MENAHLMQNCNMIRLLFIYLSLSSCSGVVTKVKDGDTIVIDNYMTIRIAEIDAPEKGQLFGYKSKDYLESIILGKKITYKEYTVDDYGRHICRIYLNDTNIGDKMVKEGYAWAYDYFAISNNIIKLQREARCNRVGMWQYQNNIKPSAYRRQHKNN
jgi:micrococcal nuclease